MFEKGLEHAIISSLSIILLLSHLPCQVDGSEASYEYALIIVSSFDPILIEDEKASDLYDHLVGSGSDPDDIIFLSAYVNTSGSDGIPTIGNVEDSFLDIKSWSTGNDRVILYISDHLPPFANGTYFRFEDGNITFAQVDEWIDSMDCSSIDIYVGGIHSGRSGNHLRGGDRTVIC
ncbi:MAG: hypothetical protein QCI82_11810, partial [Candidatus Thermoplasmatota archaeon]|nr:hypothetical protein [Candidatus Thermoplasmatota archaeon]